MFFFYFIIIIGLIYDLINEKTMIVEDFFKEVVVPCGRAYCRNVCFFCLFWLLSKVSNLFINIVSNIINIF